MPTRRHASLAQGALSLALLCFCAAVAQAQTVTGRVVTAAGQPLPDAIVQVLPDGPHANTDNAGIFRLPSVAAGNYTLSVRRLGFIPMRVAFTVPVPGSGLTVTMSPLPAQLDTMRTSALAQDLPRVLERVHSGISAVVSGSTLMKEFPGISADEVIHQDTTLGHMLQGWSICGDEVVIDGKLMPPPSWHDRTIIPQPDLGIRQYTRMRDIAEIEVTRRIEDVHEPWMGDGHFSMGCTRTVLIWTKGFKQKPYHWPP